MPACLGVGGVLGKLTLSSREPILREGALRTENSLRTPNDRGGGQEMDTDRHSSPAPSAGGLIAFIVCRQQSSCGGELLVAQVPSHFPDEARPTGIMSARPASGVNESQGVAYRQAQAGPRSQRHCPFCFHSHASPRNLVRYRRRPADCRNMMLSTPGVAIYPRHGGR